MRVILTLPLLLAAVDALVCGAAYWAHVSAPGVSPCGGGR
jgi:hypothetical protein